MPTIEFTEHFRKCFSKLPEEIRTKAKKKIEYLAVDPRHPSLQTKPVQGAEGIFEARVDHTYRMTYQRLPGDVLLLRVIGSHDETIKNP